MAKDDAADSDPEVKLVTTDAVELLLAFSP